MGALFFFQFSTSLDTCALGRSCLCFVSGHDPTLRLVRSLHQMFLDSDHLLPPSRELGSDQVFLGWNLIIQTQLLALPIPDSISPPSSSIRVLQKVSNLENDEVTCLFSCWGFFCCPNTLAPHHILLLLSSSFGQASESQGLTVTRSRSLSLCH